MSYADLPAARRELAEKILTPKQLEVLKLRLDGYSWRDIALGCSIDRKTASDRYNRALDKLRKHGR